jgi:2,4-dienoyl-CoA reductase-like NADH-dependent reductase (Old Yellow Enzyme family)
MSNESLKKPIKIGNRTATNRFVINAMECNDADEKGNPTSKTYERYENLFNGNSGVIVLEAITVDYESRARINQLGILPHNEKPLTKLVSDMKKVNDKPLFVFQLTHSGELSSDEFSKRVCVKPLAGFGGEVIEEDYIDNVLDQFVTSAKIAHAVGADGVDLKLCHGYLGSQLLRPYNDRKWKYGGPWENRSRFAFELVERVKKAINDPNFLIGSKVSMWEGFPGGQGSISPDSPIIDIKESLALCKGIEERGASFIIQSTGSPAITMALHMPDKAVPDDAYFHFSMAKSVKDVVKPETVVIGSAYSVLNNGNNALQAVEKEKSTVFYWGNKNIDDGYVDMIALGRQSLADPKLPAKYLEDKEDEIKWCTACDNCVELLIRQQNVGCTTYNKPYTQLLKDVRKKLGKLLWKVT